MKGEFFYVYMLRSLSRPEHFYVGHTEDLKQRLAEHNAGRVAYTAAVAFRSAEKALAFESI